MLQQSLFSCWHVAIVPCIIPHFSSYLYSGPVSDLSDSSMDNGHHGLSWLPADTIDFDLDGVQAKVDLSENSPLEDPTSFIPSGTYLEHASEFVNPADLCHVPSWQNGPAGLLPTMSLPGTGASVNSGGRSSTAMDEFLRSQGGWRPPVPCSHCKRLRLQCFMLQTTSANPNPITSCSSCVALYRHCSLAGPTKRQASTFETPRPVIGQLHGVYEDEQISQVMESPGPVVAATEPVTRTSKRSSSRSNTSTRPLRLWFSSNLENPYPTEEQKEELAAASGLRRTQIDNWFSNARRRKKQSDRATANASMKLHRSGSPMPRDLTANMTPLERWQHSPPDAEPAQFADIERAVDLASNSSSFDALQEFDHLPIPTPDFDFDSPWCSLPDSLDSSSNGTSSCTSQHSYASSKRSFSDTGLDTLPQTRRQQPKKRSTNTCPTCSRSFTRKSDLHRHERAIHSSRREVWICSDLILPGESATIWRVTQPGPECALCGLLNPDEKHYLSHEFVACADRSIAERTFNRKDHLFQHLEKFHRCRRKWEGWALDGAVERLRHVQTC